MPCVILLHATRLGFGATDFDGRYVKAYDPTYQPVGAPYSGGILEVTRDPNQALQFPDVAAAFEKWRQPHGIRPDGEPNRPLTAWSMEVRTV